MAYITEGDLTVFATIDSAKAQQMIEDAVAQAILAAPCLADEAELDANQIAAVKSILRGAILRWDEVGAGGVVTQRQNTVGPFNKGESYWSPSRRSLFWPTEVEQLQAICSAVTGEREDGKAFGVSTIAASTITHSETCSLVFGGTHCSCGAVLTGVGPLW